MYKRPYFSTRGCKPELLSINGVGCIFCFEIIPPPPPENHIFFPLALSFFECFLRFTSIIAQSLKKFAVAGGKALPWEKFFGNLVSEMSNFVLEKSLKTAEHSNSYLKLTICGKRPNLFNILWRIVGKKSWNGKVGGKFDIQGFSLCVVFFIFFPINKKIIPPSLSQPATLNGCAYLLVLTLEGGRWGTFIFPGIWLTCSLLLRIQEERITHPQLQVEMITSRKR